MGVSGDVYLAQRSSYAFEGFVIRKIGSKPIGIRPRQSIIDSSNPFLTMVEVVPIPNPELTTSYVLFQQVDDDTDCSDTKREGDGLF